MACGRRPADAHHLRSAQSLALGRKVSDEFTVPLCRGHHREVHRCGDEAAWWNKTGIDPIAVARVDLSQVEGFEWDQGNSRKSVEKHDVSQAEAEQVFFNEPLLIVEDVSRSSYEIRLHALGQTDTGRLLHISFTLRGNGKLIRVISARTMHRKERLRYEQEA